MDHSLLVGVLDRPTHLDAEPQSILHREPIPIALGPGHSGQPPLSLGSGLGGSGSGGPGLTLVGECGLPPASTDADSRLLPRAAVRRRAEPAADLAFKLGEERAARQQAPGASGPAARFDVLRRRGGGESALARESARRVPRSGLGQGQEDTTPPNELLDLIAANA
jgi:hypothetical protein